MIDLKEYTRRYVASHKDENMTLEDAFIKGFQFSQLVDRWRSVKQILPELGQRVLVVSLRPTGYRDIRIARLCECRDEETGEVTMLWTNPIMTETITHWMPIPELPKND